MVTTESDASKVTLKHVQGQISVRNARYRRACYNCPVFQLAPFTALHYLLVPDVIGAVCLWQDGGCASTARVREINSVERRCCCICAEALLINCASHPHGVTSCVGPTRPVSV